MKRKKTSEEVEFKSVLAALGIDEEKVAEGNDTYDANSLTEDIKTQDSILSLLNANLDRIVTRYEKNPEDRTEIETAYTIKLNVLSHMAKLFNPFTTYGRDRLKEVRKCSKEYESFVAPLITRITKDNIDSFSKVLTSDLKEDVEVGKLHALGAIRSSNSEPFGAGAIVYKVEQSPFVDGNIGRILWLYVHEDFRKLGTANHLLAELMAAMQEQNIEHITMNSPLGDDMDQVKGYFMASWLFEMENTINPDCMMRIRDIKNIQKLKDYTKGVNTLASLKDGTGANGVKNALKRIGRPAYLSNETMDSDYIDPDLSYYLGTETTIKAMLLTHRLPSGTVRVEYLRSESDSIEDEKKLISCFIKDAVIKCSEDTVLYIPLNSEDMAYFLEGICPVQQGQYLLEGILSPTIAYDEDIDKSMVKSALEV